MSRLSEPHNFGQYVQVSPGGDIAKPRPLFWEWILYSTNPFRKFLDDHGVAAALPKLAFSGDIYAQGSVEAFNPLHLNYFSATEFEGLGAMIALYAFLGIDDLHRENVIFGLNGGAFKCCSVDIESFFGDFSDAGQTGLLPTVAIPLRDCGLRDLITLARESNLEMAAAVAHGYLRSLKSLLIYENHIWSHVINLLDEKAVPIRVLLRKTLSYARFLADDLTPSAPEPKFIQPEFEQLARGDFPYFFRWPGSFRVHYWQSPGLAVDVDDLVRPHFRFLESRLLTSNSIQQRKNGKFLIDRGLAQVVRSFSGRTKGKMKAIYGDVELNVTPQQIEIASTDLRISCRPMVRED